MKMMLNIPVGLKYLLPSQNRISYNSSTQFYQSRTINAKQQVLSTLRLRDRIRESKTMH